MPWGVPVPGDDDHVMYVWFDALNSYISTLGWGSENEETFAKFWAEGEVTQYCGKDNNKAQSAIWQAMLLSSGLKNTDTININGHIISGGVKMSKSIGNVISPFDIIEKYKSVTDYPEEVLRFVMCHEVSTYDDSDITMDSISSAYTAFLQNGIGNQLNRILKLSSQYLGEDKIKEILSQVEKTSLDQSYKDLLANFKINEAVHIVTDKVKSLDEYIQSTEPFKLVKNDETLEKGREIISKCIFDLLDIGHHLYYFMPKTAMFIYDHASKNKMPEKPLFNRLG
jgi:methionyl-tRNA synthetase